MNWGWVAIWPFKTSNHKNVGLFETACLKKEDLTIWPFLNLVECWRKSILPMPVLANMSITYKQKLYLIFSNWQPWTGLHVGRERGWRVIFYGLILLGELAKEGTRYSNKRKTSSGKKLRTHKHTLTYNKIEAHTHTNALTYTHTHPHTLTHTGTHTHKCHFKLFSQTI